MVGRALNKLFIGTIFSGLLAGLMGCTSVSTTFEPAPPVKHRKVVRVAPQPKVVKYKKASAGKVIKPSEEAPKKPPVIPALGGGSGGNGGNSGGSGGGNGGWG